MTALIIGAGVTGPVTAMALQRAGIEAAVYEAYPTTAHGIGASMGDALELARCLRDTPEPAAAFAAYQDLREGRVRRVYDNARKINSSKAAGPIGRVLRDLLLPVLAKKMAKPESVSWLHGHHIEFDAPVPRAA